MTQYKAHSAHIGPTWPDVAGFGEGTPQQAFLWAVRAAKRASVNTLALLATIQKSNTLENCFDNLSAFYLPETSYLTKKASA